MLTNRAGVLRLFIKNFLEHNFRLHCQWQCYSNFLSDSSNSTLSSSYSFVSYKIKHMNNQILVLGGTGKTGKRVAERLTKLNLPVRIASRNTSPAFDWENPYTWPNALNRIQKVYMSFQPDLAIPGSTDKIESFTEAAKKAGVQKLVLLSGRGEEEAQLCENIVMNSGLDWGVVRASWFMQNFSEGFFLDSILNGHAVVPKGSAPEPFVDVDDIADMAVLQLTDDKHAKTLYELTGPELLTFKEIFNAISAAIDRPVTYEEVSMEEYVDLLKKYKVPGDYIWLIKYLFTEIFDGRNESLTPDIEKVLGRKPTSLKTYVEKTRKTGIWNTTK